MANVFHQMSEPQADPLDVPITLDESTFHDIQKKRFREVEKKMEEAIRKKKKDWEKQVERMQEEFLELHPTKNKIEELERRPSNSSDTINVKKMRTVMLDYPESGRRFKLRFNVKDFDLQSVKVNFDKDKIAIRATKLSDDGNEEFCRKVEKPKEVDANKLKSFLTKDGILVIDAPLPPKSLEIQKAQGSPSHNSTRSRSPSNSPSSTESSFSRVGVPQFDGDPEERRLNLVVDIGTLFKPREITVQIIKDNRIQVKARHEERTSERMMKSKFNKEYELSEKIEPFSLRAGLTEDGMLIVGALGKHHNLSTKDSAKQEVSKEINSTASPCNVLDLASFPPSHVVNNNPV